MVYKIERFGERFKLTVIKQAFQSERKTDKPFLTPYDFERDMSVRSYHDMRTAEIKEFLKQYGEKKQGKSASNLSRTKSRVLELALCNDWQYFVTLTINGDKQDRHCLANYIKSLGVWIGNYNKKYNTKLSYLIVPEQHKDGAWHCHGLFNGVSADSLVKNQFGYLDLPYYQNRFGYISLSPVKNKNKCSTYVSKYIVKQYENTALSGIEIGKHMFYASRGLQGKQLVEVGDVDDYVLFWKQQGGEDDGRTENKSEDNAKLYWNDFVGIKWADDVEFLERIVEIDNPIQQRFN